MTEMTPEKLRLIAAYCRERDDVGDEGTANEFDAAASAWEADRKRLEELRPRLQERLNDVARARLALKEAEAHIEALEKALPAKDAEALARVCMSFAGEMLHKQDDIGQRFWTEQAKRLRAYAALAAKEET